MILGIEADHFDCFTSIAELEAAFADFAARGAGRGLVLVRADCAATRRAIRGLTATMRVVRSDARRPTWHATELRERRGLYSFQIRCRERTGVRRQAARAGTAQRVERPGRRRAGQPRGRERHGDSRRLERFRRARAPTGTGGRGPPSSRFSTTMRTIPRRWRPRWRPCGRCIPAAGCGACFEPHQASRTRHLLDEFAHSLQNADKIIVTRNLSGSRSRRRRRRSHGRRDLAARIASMGRRRRAPGIGSRNHTII